MRELKITDQRTTNRTKDAISAIAWATNRQGRNPWHGTNVSTDMIAYFQRHHAVVGDLFKPAQLTYVLKLLADKKFAEIKNSDKGVTYFAFLPDVQLNGHSPVFKEAPKAVTYEVSQVHVTDLPLPNVPRYLKEDLDNLLDKFYEHDPEGYADYADKLKAALEANLT